MSDTMTTENPQQWQSELLDPRGQNTISEMAQVKVYNDGPKSLIWEWGGERKEIPGTQDAKGRPNYAIVPYHMMVYWVGDPRAIDIPGNPRERARTHEFERLCVVYGVYENTNNLNPELGTTSNFPNVRVVTPTNEYPITTVLSDPDGETLNVAFQARNDVTHLQDVIAAQAQQMQMLQLQMDQLLREQGQRQGNSVPSLSEKRIAEIQVSDDPQYTPEPVDDGDAKVDPNDADADDEPPRIIDTSNLTKAPGSSAAADQIAAALAEAGEAQPADDGPRPDVATRTVPMSPFGRKG